MSETDLAASGRTDGEGDRLLAWYRQYLEGDEQALEHIVQATIDPLLLFTCSLVHDLPTAEEIVDDAFVHITVKRRAFRGDSQLKTYLYAVCRNIACKRLRTRSRRPEKPVGDWPPGSAETETLEARVIRNERDAQLRSAMAELKEEYRAVLHLVFFERMTIDQASEIMCKTYKQTDNLIQRAKKSLRTRLEKEGFDRDDL